MKRFEISGSGMGRALRTIRKRPERLQLQQEIFQQQIHKAYNPENQNGENQ